MGNFTQQDIQYALETQSKYGVPASVTLAQYALESGYGKSPIGNNYFGITGKNVNTGAYKMAAGRSWAAYNSKQESFLDYGRLMSSSLYSSKTAGARNANEYIDAIAETYAPSSDGNNGYAAKIKSIIASNNLTQYDTVFSGGSTSSRFPSRSDASSGGTYAAGGNKISGGIVGTIIKFVALVAIAIVAAVLFLNAFDISVSPTRTIQKQVKKAVASDGD